MELLAQILAIFFLVVGTLLSLIGVIGFIRLPDVYADREGPPYEQARVYGEEGVGAPVPAILVDAKQRRAVVRHAEQQHQDGRPDQTAAHADVGAVGGEDLEGDEVPEAAAEQEVGKRAIEPAAGGIGGRGGHAGIIARIPG